MSLRRTLPTLALGALLLSGCPRTGPASVADLIEDLDFAMTPRLPSPEAGTYASAPGAPRDQVIGEMLRGKPHDGALAGAAAGIALSMTDGDGGMSRWELREALWRAGFPYPVYDARSWTVGINQPPPRDLVAWVDALSPDEPMGLVRARGRDFDVWVGMRAKPQIDLGTAPRMATLGMTVSLPPTPGATFRATDAGGDLQQGALDEGATIALTSSGEWLVEIMRGKEELARFPVYVDIEPPTVPLLRADGMPGNVSSKLDVAIGTRRLIAHIREMYGMPAWQQSPVFDAAVQSYIANPAGGSRAVLASLGFPNVRSVVWACDQVTIENCFDNWVWDLKRRRTLLTDAVDSYGLHVGLDARGVHLTLMLVDTNP